ncbi:MAG: hypothetical protein QF718_04940 [Phycisphaerales bacterium]|jgi:hypothetical protein|nr:hypothetical protein [Phycisphaerales bacterium]
MRCDRGTTFVTVLILMCCIGGSVTTGTIATHRVLIRTVSQHGGVVLTEVSSLSQNLGVPTIWNPQILDGNQLPQADIEDLHNLPPPDLG